MELSTKINKLVELLNVCPLCIAGYLKEEKKRDVSLAIAMAFDDYNQFQHKYCSSPLCDYSIELPNKNYEPDPRKRRNARITSHKSESKSSDQESFDLFG